MGVVVRRYIDILIIIISFPYSTCISSFLAAASLLLCSFLKCFFRFVYVIFVQYSKHCSKNIQAFAPGVFVLCSVLYKQIYQRIYDKKASFLLDSTETREKKAMACSH